MIIKEIKDKRDIENSVRIIIKSFKTVALEFNLTKENCPAHPSFITFDKLNEYPSKGIKMFGLFESKEKKPTSQFITSKNLPFYRNTGIMVMENN